MTTGLIKPGESITVSFMWMDDNGEPLTSLSPAPTLTLTEPDGTETTPALVQRGSTAYFDYTLTPDAVGLWALVAECTDSDCATPFTEPVAVWVTTNSLSDLPLEDDLADVSEISSAVWDYLTSAATTVGSMGKALVDFIASVTNWLSGGGGVTVVSPVSPNTGRLTLYQGQAYEENSGLTVPAWTSTDWAPFDLSAAVSVTWYLKNKTSGIVLSGAMDVVSDTQIRALTFAAAVTDTLTPSTNVYTLQIWAVLDAAHDDAEVILVDAPVTVLNDVRQ